MSRSSAENIYDVIVVGTGPIGQTVADRACHARGVAEPDMQAITILGGNR